MIEQDGNAVVTIPITKLTAAGTAYVASFDTRGYDHANIYLNAYSSSASLSSIVLKESDTVTSG